MTAESHANMPDRQADRLAAEDAFVAAYFAAMLALITSAFSVEPRAANSPTVQPSASRRRGQAATEVSRRRAARAFAIAPGGGWAGARTRRRGDGAGAGACHLQSACAQTCVPYAVDTRVVLTRALATLWRPTSAPPRRPGRRPHPTRRALSRPAPERAQRQALAPVRPAQQGGGAAFLGSWCPSCVRELPQFESLQSAFKGRNDIVSFTRRHANRRRPRGNGCDSASSRSLADSACGISAIASSASPTAAPSPTATSRRCFPPPTCSTAMCGGVQPARLGARLDGVRTVLRDLLAHSRRHKSHEVPHPHERAGRRAAP